MSAQWRVAVVEDDRRLARAVTTGLKGDGYRVRTAGSAAEGLALVRRWSPDVVLLDLMLPDNDGPELFARFRTETDSVLMGMTARSLLLDRVSGFRHGADDYVVKPFAFEELSARIAAQLRRTSGRGAERLQALDLVVDLEAASARRGERDLDLTSIEFRLLTALVREAGRVVTREQLMHEIWSHAGRPGSNSVEVHVLRLRRKLEAGGEPRILHTARGRGYVLKRGGSR